jgi:hypothetical protein
MPTSKKTGERREEAAKSLPQKQRQRTGFWLEKFSPLPTHAGRTLILIRLEEIASGWASRSDRMAHFRSSLPTPVRYVDYSLRQTEKRNESIDFVCS